MKARIKLGFRYDADEVVESECKTRDELEESINKNAKGLWDELKSEIDFDIVDNPDDSKMSDMSFEYEILEDEE